MSNGRITDKLFLFETMENSGTEGRPTTRRKQRIWKAFTQNGERTWEVVDKDLWEDKEVLLLAASQNFETSKQEAGTSDQ